MIFLLGFGKNKVQQEQDELSMNLTSNTSYIEKAPWYIKLLFALRLYISEIDPMILVLYIIGIVWLVAFIWTMMFPFMDVIEDIPNKMPFMGGVTIIFFVWWLASIYYNNVEGGKCTLSLDGITVYVDNSRIDVLPKSERIYIVNSFGKPVYNNEKSNPIRYRTQKTISIPKEVIDQFGTVRGKRAMSYSDCKLNEITTEGVDYTIFYMPRHISEEKLIKENQRLKLIHSIAVDTIRKLEQDMLRAVKNLRESDKQHLEQLIEGMSGLRKAFYGSDERTRELIRQEMNFRGSNWRKPGTFQRNYTNPSWQRHTQPDNKPRP